MELTKKQKRFLEQLDKLSLQYHKLSILMHELKQSITIEIKKNNIRGDKQFKDYINNKLNVNFNKIMNYSFKELTFKELKGGTA